MKMKTIYQIYGTVESGFGDKFLRLLDFYKLERSSYL